MPVAAGLRTPGGRVRAGVDQSSREETAEFSDAVSWAMAIDAFARSAESGDVGASGVSSEPGYGREVGTG